MLGSSEWSSGCESGWTLYLDHSVSSFPSSSCFRDINGFENRRRSKDSWSQNYVHQEEDEEEDLSMMSDASSGPRNVCEEDSVKKLNSVGPKKQNKSEKKRRDYEKMNSVLDDTASSHMLQKSVGGNKIEQTFPESTLDYSQGFSATHIQTIPLDFFSKHIEGKTNQKTWKLRSDASDQTWEVIQEGRTLTRGWKDFTTAHDLQIGDLVIFKHEGDMVFHVTPFGPSCCEIQYTHPHIIKEEADSGDADDNEIRGTGAMSSFSYDFCFLAEFTASNLKADKLYLPKRATSSTALNKQCQEMILVNKEGNSWTASLRFSESGGMYYITRGWEKFCRDNICDIGDLFVFNLVGDGKTTPLLCVCPESKKCSELLSKHLSRKRELPDA
ncbi:hypothetical protein IGI04_013724 [Brassica rapa subsp. trilocularis]|uniref:TF-B3 domain-containing protein n=1 Tax=Brassica rapa subsp. trilocularis TaxID=1813537 RepID=A0ABQ7NC19_BRACM|nr:hypothetical protein IGI04_013724 [Brassica rapa subsp. trilocularis]